jgi:hypothetical protein
LRVFKVSQDSKADRVFKVHKEDKVLLPQALQV